VIEEDDGSGWVKVADSQGRKGLIPASYVSDSDAETSSTVTPANSRTQKGSGSYGEHVFA
jgi:uncharacterized protein YgiM (DUF1202 family)